MAADAFRILFVDDVHPALTERLALLPHVEIDYQPQISPEAVAAALRTADGLVVRSKVYLDAHLLAAAPRLKFIARAGAGMDNIDEAVANSLGIRLFNAPEGNRQAVAEHVLGMLLTLFNKLREADASVRAGIWDREGHRGLELQGKTVGLIGYGNNGQATARLLHAFGCKVLAYDKFKTGFSDAFVKEASLEQLFEKAEILSLHLPLTSESRGMVNADFLGAFERLQWVVNAARGEILVLADLVAKLEAGKLKGACLDVLENEKPASWNRELMERLKAHKGVILSPHIAGWSVESYRKISEVLADKLLAEFFVDFR